MTVRRGEIPALGDVFWRELRDPFSVENGRLYALGPILGLGIPASRTRQDGGGVASARRGSGVSTAGRWSQHGGAVERERSRGGPGMERRWRRTCSWVGRSAGTACPGDLGSKTGPGAVLGYVRASCLAVSRQGSVAKTEVHNPADRSCLDAGSIL